MKRHAKAQSPSAGLLLFGLAIFAAPAILAAGAIGGTIAAMAQRPRVRR